MSKVISGGAGKVGSEVDNKGDPCISIMGGVFYQDWGVRNGHRGHLHTVFTPRRSILAVGLKNGRSGIRVV